jgi:hypothetical protein
LFSFREKELRRLRHRFVADPECAPMNRYEMASAKIEECLKGGCRVEMEILEPVFRLVCSDREQCDIDSESLPELLKETVVCRVPGKIDGMATSLNDIA